MRLRPQKGSERRFEKMEEFLPVLVKELNDLAAEGGAVLVEGKRDVAALKGLGYSGPVFTISILTSSQAARQRLRNEVRQMVILTDMDAEGRRLASRYVRFLTSEGVRPSLAERRRLKAAAGGVFRHIENLSRFADLSHDILQP